MREQKSDPLTIKGSFAGRIGLPQFMPGSIRRHAVDFDGDGRVDLSGSASDAIGSVASFLAAHGGSAICRSCSMRSRMRRRSTHSDAASKRWSPWSDALAAGVEGDVPLPFDERCW